MDKKIDRIEMVRSICEAEMMFGRLEKEFVTDDNGISCKLYYYGQCVAVVKQDGEIRYLIKQ